MEAQALTPTQVIKKDLNLMKDQFKNALPSHISVEKFINTIQTAMITSPDLAEANRTSFYGACMKAASDGLLPDGKEAALVKFKTKDQVLVQYMPMIGGLLKKVRNSGELSTITAQIVYKNDDFSFYIDSDGEHLEHRPDVFSDRGAMVGCYALAKTKDNSVYIEVLTTNEINAIEKVSRAKFGPWKGPFRNEMIKKSAIRRLSKRLPMSTDVENSIKADDDLFLPSKEVQEVQAEQLEQAEVKRIEEKETPKNLEKLLTEGEI